MAENLSRDNSREIVGSGKLKVSTKTLRHGGGQLVIQVRNISSVTVEKYETRTSGWPTFLCFIVLFAGLAFVFSSASDIDIILGSIFIFISASELIGKLDKEIIFLLNVELDSGYTYSFRSNSKNFLEEVVDKIYGIMDSPDVYQKFEVNLQTNNFVDNSTHQQYAFGDTVSGDKIQGDRIAGDKIHGDKVQGGKN